MRGPRAASYRAVVKMAANRYVDDLVQPGCLPTGVEQVPPPGVTIEWWLVGAGLIQ